MFKALTADSVFAEVMMEEPPPLAMLLVEGPDEDAVFFEHLADGVVRIVAGNKKAVLGAADLAYASGMTNVFGLVDRDFDSLRRKDTYPPNVVATDGYDLVADLLRVLGDDVLRRIMSAHAVSAVRTVENSAHRSVVDVVFGLTTPLAAVRLSALCSHYPLVFQNYDFKRVANGDFEAGDVDVYAKNARFSDPSFTIDNSVLQDMRDRLLEVSDRRHVGGHDFVSASVAVLALGGVGVAKKAIAGSILSRAESEVLGSISCLRLLNKIASERSGTHLIDCVA